MDYSDEMEHSNFPSTQADVVANCKKDDVAYDDAPGILMDNFETYPSRFSPPKDTGSTSSPRRRNETSGNLVISNMLPYQANHANFGMSCESDNLSRSFPLRDLTTPVLPTPKLDLLPSNLEPESDDSSLSTSGTYVTNLGISSPRKRKRQVVKSPKKSAKLSPEIQRKHPLYRDRSMKFYGIQCQNKDHTSSRIGFISRGFKVSHENALCAVLKKETDHNYDKLPRDRRIFDLKITSEMSGSDFKDSNLQYAIIDTSDWWHAQYNTDEFLLRNYWSENIFLTSDLTLNGELEASKYSILSGYRINGTWISIRFGIGKRKQAREGADKNAWKINFHGDPFFHPEENVQENPSTAMNKIRDVCNEDRIQLRILEFTKTAQFGRPGHLKPVLEVLPEKIDEKLRAQKEFSLI